MKCSKVECTSKGLVVVGFKSNETEHFQEHQAHQLPIKTSSSTLQASRRVFLGLAAIGVSLQSGIEKSLAEDNGYWLTGPLPIPPVLNKIANEETGTRSFLKKGIHVPDIGPKGSAYRLRKNAFDLTALGDMLGQDVWHYIRKYLRLKSSIMYYDFDTVISAAPVNDKEPLTKLANRLFDNVEKLEAAVKLHDLPETESCYQETTSILQEVMNIA
ncbi:Photosynthetic ndh subunit of lumenal location 3 protein [Thalictrum thalictroides]|uniref:Photosynthetic ndh subunit of lumenal location 3 protein n=1 Tax=Thalictrum thalictroides TaxID=46969 RepID=A0A7J6XDK5_THATH|nr:Photosynthetic ndh subunit of lumenal location 3 protein [Thalictrum thalictroides]